MTPKTLRPGERRAGLPPWARLTLTVSLLYVFLVAIKLMESSFKLMGGGSAGSLFEGIESPFAGLMVGVLGTVLVQSSSVTTATIVALVGSGQIGLEAAVPMIMGANIGTTVTNTLVSIGSVRRSNEFKLAFACATMHDFFNYLCVAVFLPLELATGFLSKTAVWLSGMLTSSGTQGASFKSPIKSAVKAGSKQVQGLLESTGLEDKALAVTLLLLAIGLIFLCLHNITKQMKLLLAARIEAGLNAALARSGLVGVAVGMVVTVAVQSSSITTSLLVPLCAAGILTLDNALPVTLGANIGTTVTALLASLAAESTAGLSIALVHVLFNLSGAVCFFPVPLFRRLPVLMSERLAELATRNKLWILVYVGAMFVALPLIGVFVIG